MRGVQQVKPRPRDAMTGVIVGAEPFAMGQGSRAILFLHGWTSTPRELRGLAEKAAQAGFHCQGPLLRGHGTQLADLVPTRFPDYLAQAEQAYTALAKTHERVFVCGLSMGGLLGLELAARFPVAGLILIAPFLIPFGKTLGLPNRWLIGRVPLPALLAKSAGGPIQEPIAAQQHIAYHAMPSASMVSVVQAARAMRPLIPKVLCPTLILHDVHDQTSDFRGSERLLENLGAKDKTLVAFERGNHLITLDYDRERLEATVLAWLRRQD
jgi:carboxylesterase